MPTESLTNDSRFVNETMLVNVTGSIRRETYNGRRYLVAPMVTIVPGVLNGSRGALYYPPEEVSKEPGVWNHVPLVLNHPMEGGQYVSARSPGVLEKYQLGYVFNDRWDGSRRTAEGWFDEEHTRRISPEVYDALSNNRPIELSTGLMTDNHIAANGSNYNGKPYTHVARNYRPDHLAILPKQRGACSNKDGCGVLVNANPEGINQYSSGSAQGSADVSGSPAMTDAQKKYPEMAHMLNGAKLHSEGLSKKAAREEAKSLRRDGKYSNVWKDEKTGKHFVTVVNSACECGGTCEKCKLRDETKSLLGQELVENCGGPGSGVPGPCSGLKAAPQVDATSGNPSQRAKIALGKIKEAHQLGQTGTDEQKASAAKASELSQKAIQSTGAAGKSGSRDSDREAEALHRSAAKAHRDAIGFSGRGTPRGDAHYEAAKEHDMIAAEHSHRMSTRNELTDNALGRGNHSLAKRASHAEELSKLADSATEMATDAESHKAAKEAHEAAAAAHRSAAYEAAHGMSTWAEPDFGASGMHANRAKNHDDKARNHETQSSQSPSEATVTNRQGDDMPINRAEVIANLTTNCDCWRGKEKTLNSLDDSTLETVANQQAQLAQRELVVNAAKEIVGDVALNAMPAALQAAMDKKAGKTPAKAPVTDPEEEEDDVEDEEAMVKNFLKLPADKRMLPGELEALNFAKGMVSNAKTRLVEKIVTANSATETGRKAIRPTFEAMDLKTLQTLAAEVDSRPTANEHQAEVVNNHLIDYLGLGGAYSPSRGQVNNVDEDDVLSPYAYQHAKPKK